MWSKPVCINTAFTFGIWVLLHRIANLDLFPPLIVAVGTESDAASHQ